MVRNAIRNTFLNMLTVGTSFTCFPAAFQEGERPSHAFSVEVTTAFNIMSGVSESDCIRAPQH